MTALEFIESKFSAYDSIELDDMERLMIEFAKYHVKKALEAALEEAPYGGSDEVRYEDVVGILTCYPESNIK